MLNYIIYIYITEEWFIDMEYFDISNKIEIRAKKNGSALGF